MDIFTLLKEDHRAVQRGLDRFLNEREEVGEMRSVCNALERHMNMEEEVLYPRLQEKDELKDLVRDAKEEHGKARTEVEHLRDNNRDVSEYRHCAQKLLDLVNHHIDDEENKIFPKMQDVFSDSELDTMCRKAQEAKREKTKSRGQ